MKLTVDGPVDGLFIRAEEVEGNQGQHDRCCSQGGLKRGTQEEIQAQAESFLFLRDRIEPGQQAFTQFELGEINQRLPGLFQGGQEQRTARTCFQVLFNGSLFVQAELTL